MVGLFEKLEILVMLLWDGGHV